MLKSGRKLSYCFSTLQTNILTGNSADHPLVQFCSWMDRYDKSRGLKEDVAVLLTKQGMCDSTNDECNVLGEGDWVGLAGVCFRLFIVCLFLQVWQTLAQPVSVATAALSSETMVLAAASAWLMSWGIRKTMRTKIRCLIFQRSHNNE